jgi:hypothetical protein
MTAIGTGVNRSATAEAAICFPSITTSAFTVAHGYAANQALMWTAIGRWQSAANMIGSYTYGQGIVETATNSNGTYIKFDNGTMVCHGTVSYSSTVARQTIITGKTTPAAFMDSNWILHVMLLQDVTNYSIIQNPNVAGVSTFGFAEVALDAVNLTAVSKTALYIAIGRWK